MVREEGVSSLPCSTWLDRRAQIFFPPPSVQPPLAMAFTIWLRVLALVAAVSNGQCCCPLGALLW